MAKALTYGTARSGYFEIVRNSRAVDQVAFKSKVNGATDSGVEEFNEGEWAVLDADFLATKAGASAAKAAWPCVIGYERGDVRGSRSTTLALGFGYHLRTNAFRLDATVTAGDYTYGKMLTVKSGKLEPATTGEQILAMVVQGVKATASDAEKALNKTPFNTIVVEVGPRGAA